MFYCEFDDLQLHHFVQKYYLLLLKTNSQEPLICLFITFITRSKIVVMVSTREVRVGSCASVNNDRIHSVKTNYHLISLAGHNITNFNKLKTPIQRQ